MTAHASRGARSWPRVARWDVGVVLAQLATATGTVLTDDGRCAGGQVGAAYVRRPDGRRSVLTCQPPGSLASVRRAEALLAMARDRGLPVPRYELVAELPCAVAIVQELLPGSPPWRTDRQLVESMVEMNRRCRGLLADRAEVPAPSLYLRADGPGFCLHGPLAGHDRRTSRLLDAIEEIGAAVPEHLAGGDLVHVDYHPGNVLVDAGGRITGIVDWDAASRSDGRLDLCTLRFDLARRAPGLGRSLGNLLRETMPETVAQACWAHMSLRMVDWSIRHLTPADVTAWLDIADELRP